MGKFITLREEFEVETGCIDDKGYIEWLEAIVKNQKMFRDRVYFLLESQKDIDSKIAELLNDKFHDLF